MYRFRPVLLSINQKYIFHSLTISRNNRKIAKKRIQLEKNFPGTNNIAHTKNNTQWKCRNVGRTSPFDPLALLAANTKYCDVEQSSAEVGTKSHIPGILILFNKCNCQIKWKTIFLCEWEFSLLLSHHLRASKGACGWTFVHFGYCEYSEVFQYVTTLFWFPMKSCRPHRLSLRNVQLHLELKSMLQIPFIKNIQKTIFYKFPSEYSMNIDVENFGKFIFNGFLRLFCILLRDNYFCLPRCLWNRFINLVLIWY